MLKNGVYPDFLSFHGKPNRTVISTCRPVYRGFAFLCVALPIYVTVGPASSLRDAGWYGIGVCVAWCGWLVFTVCFALPHQRLILDRVLGKLRVQSGVALIYMPERALMPNQVSSVEVVSHWEITRPAGETTFREDALKAALAVFSGMSVHTPPGESSPEGESIYALRIQCRDGTSFVTHQTWDRESVQKAAAAVKTFCGGGTGTSP